MHRANAVAARGRNEVHVETVGIERGKRRKQSGHRLQTDVKRLIGRQLVLAHLLAPEALAVQPDIPV